MAESQLASPEIVEALRRRLLEPGSLPCLDRGRTLEPQLAELLIYLAARPGRVIDKHELFQEVWKGKAITDEAIWRAVADLRKALGDEARSPRFIETVHRRGYRFVGVVSDLLEPKTSEEAADEPGDAECDDDRAPFAGGAFVGMTPFGRWQAAGPHRLLRILGLLAIGSLLIFLGSQVVLQGEQRRLESRSEVTPERDWHLLVMVDNLTEFAPLVAATETALSVFLEQASNVSVARFSHMGDELARMQLAPGSRLDYSGAIDLCLREGLTGLLRVTILPEGNQFRFIGEVTEAATREVVFSQTTRAESRETFLRALDRLGGELEKFLIGSSPIPTLPLAKATTHSLEALVLYSRAGEAARTYDFEAADRLLSAALISDPGFTLARARQVILHVNRRESFDFEGLRELFASESAHLTSFERATLRAWWQTLSSRHDAIESWRSLTQRYPHRPSGWMNLAYVSYFWLADCEQAAAAFARGRKIPGVRRQTLAQRLAIGTSLCLGRGEEALEMAEALPAGFKDRDLRIAQVLSANGSHREATSHLDAAAPELALEVTSARALGWIDVGRLAAAKEMLADGLRQPGATPTDRVTPLAYLSTLESLDPSGSGCAHLEEWVESVGARDLRSPFLDDSPVIGRALVGVISARCGDLATAADLLEELQSPQARAREISTERAWVHLLAGEIKLASGHHAEAVIAFESALREVDWVSARFGLARAWVAKEEGESAIRELSKITDQPAELYRNPHFDARALTLLDWHLALFELGAAQESLGRSRASRQAYLAFIEEWQGMDLDLPRYRAAKARVGSSSGP